MADADKPVPALTVAEAREKLRPFLDANPASSVEEVESQDGKNIAIKKPWGDDSLVIYLPEDIQPFVGGINPLYLPERFTAVWHTDSTDLEVIWTAHPLSEAALDLKERKFSFRNSGHEYECEFSRSSDRLLLLAKNSRPISVSKTLYRNLQSFNAYARNEKSGNGADDIPRPLTGEPFSFWIRKIDWNEDEVLNLVRHLNFYMKYYDALSPEIFIHSSGLESEAHHPRTRYIADQFPERINAKELDDNLLRFWSASQDGDPANRFLYSYRIIEHSSLSYIDSNAKQSIRKILSAPNALDNLQAVTDLVVDAVQDSRMEDAQKILAVLRETVDPNLLWREIEKNPGAFSVETRFDGGFVLPQLISADGTKDDFIAKGLQNFCSAIRSIRNALAHGKDHRSSGVITPTTRNFDRLRPWTALISVAAGEVMVYRGVL